MQYTADFIKALTSPDRRYGEVPFYWWNGGELTKERLTSQLEALAEKGLAGVQVNYCHINGGGGRVGGEGINSMYVVVSVFGLYLGLLFFVGKQSFEVFKTLLGSIRV